MSIREKMSFLENWFCVSLNEMKKNKLIIVLGPTSSGKSDLAVLIARFINSQGQSAEVVSADSRQVYKGMDIGSGKITREEMKGIPHHMLDIASPTETYSAAKYQKDARDVLQKLWNEGKIPIVCGGTGFYIQTIVDGMEIPEVRPNEKLRKSLNKKSDEELFKLLKERDPRRSETIDSKNRHRLIRAIEIAESLGSVPVLKKEPVDAELLLIGIQVPFDVLKKRIQKRLLKRIDEGMFGEIKELHDSGVSWEKLESFGLEYRYVSLFLQKKLEREEAIQLLLKETEKYAKRQNVWFKRDKRIKWIRNNNEVFPFLEKFLS